MTDIERLARVLYAELHGSAVQPEMAVETVEHYSRFVIAILDALAEPSEGMVQAAIDVWQARLREKVANGFRIDPPAVPLVLNWQAMLNHVREGGQ